LIHELAHIAHSNHLLPFKELDSKLAKELAAFYSDPLRKGNRLGGEIEEAYDPAEARQIGEAMNSGSCEVEATTNGLPSSGDRLGGESSTDHLSAREKAAKAAEARTRRN